MSQTLLEHGCRIEGIHKGMFLIYIDALHLGGTMRRLCDMEDGVHEMTGLVRMPRMR